MTYREKQDLTASGKFLGSSKEVAVAQVGGGPPTVRSLTPGASNRGPRCADAAREVRVKADTSRVQAHPVARPFRVGCGG